MTVFTHIDEMEITQTRWHVYMTIRYKNGTEAKFIFKYEHGCGTEFMTMKEYEEED